MAQYDHYTPEQLFEAIKTSDASVRSYLIRLLLQKTDNKGYIKELLSMDDLRKDILRLLSPSDASRFADTISQLLDASTVKTKKILISRLEGAKNPSLIAALLRRVKDGAEDPSVRRMSITTLGNSGASEAVAEQITEFDKQDVDGKTEILTALNKIDREAAMPLFKKALHDESEIVRSWAENALGKAGERISSSVRTDYSGLYRSWIRDPLSFPDTSELSFFENGRGYYEEAKAGEVELRIEFRFRVLGGTIVFIAEPSLESATDFAIAESQFMFPYYGRRKCQILKFFRKDIRMKGIDITGSDYYYLLEDA